MPLYEYECLKCGSRIEVIQRVGDGPIEACQECQGEMRRLLSAPAFQFKGSGWYVTDYAKKGGESDSAAKPKSAEAGGKTDKAASSGKKSKTTEGGD